MSLKENIFNKKWFDFYFGKLSFHRAQIYINVFNVKMLMKSTREVFKENAI